MIYDVKQNFESPMRLIVAVFVLGDRRPVAQLLERRTAVWEVSGSSPRPDQHSGS